MPPTEVTLKWLYFLCIIFHFDSKANGLMLMQFNDYKEDQLIDTILSELRENRDRIINYDNLAGKGTDFGKVSDNNDLENRRYVVIIVPHGFPINLKVNKGEHKLKYLIHKQKQGDSHKGNVEKDIIIIKKQNTDNTAKPLKYQNFYKIDQDYAYLDEPELYKLAKGIKSKKNRTSIDDFSISNLKFGPIGKIKAKQLLSYKRPSKESRYRFSWFGPIGYHGLNGNRAMLEDIQELNTTKPKNDLNKELINHNDKAHKKSEKRHVKDIAHVLQLIRDNIEKRRDKSDIETEESLAQYSKEVDEKIANSRLKKGNDIKDILRLLLNKNNFFKFSDNTKKRNVEARNKQFYGYEKRYGPVDFNTDKEGYVLKRRGKKQTNSKETVDENLRTFFKSHEENDPLSPSKYMSELESESTTEKTKIWIPHYPFWNYWTYDKTLHQDACKGNQIRFGELCIAPHPH